MNRKQLQLVIDRCIKEVWLTDIPQDYARYYLLKEDTLKNALYFYLRKRLQQFFSVYRLRIYTEYHYKGAIADLALVKLKKDDEEFEHLRDAVDTVLAVIEVKYKNGRSTSPFEEDIQKVKHYLDSEPVDKCQFYLAFLHERIYDGATEKSWLTERQKSWADGRLTELNGYYQNQQDDYITWEVISYNNFEEDSRYHCTLKVHHELLVSKAKEFNEKKYSHDYYHHYLHVIESAPSVNEELIEAVRNLFFWKLGKVSSYRTKKVNQLPFQTVKPITLMGQRAPMRKPWKKPRSWNYFKWR